MIVVVSDVAMVLNSSVLPKLPDVAAVMNRGYGTSATVKLSVQVGGAGSIVTRYTPLIGVGAVRVVSPYSERGYDILAFENQNAGKTGTDNWQDDVSRLGWVGYVDYAGPESGRNRAGIKPEKPELPAQSVCG